MCHAPSTRVSSPTQPQPEPHASRVSWRLPRVAGMVIFPLASPCPLSGDGVGVTLKVLSSSSSPVFQRQPSSQAMQEATESCLNRTEDTPVTQEILRGSGAPCQELGSNINIKTKDALSTPIAYEGLRKFSARTWGHTRTCFTGATANY